MDVLSRWPVNRTTVPTAAQVAAISWARRPPPQLAGQQPGERDDRPRGDRRRQPQDGERIGVDLAHRPGDQRGHRALVHIRPIEMATGLEEVELVAVIAVAAGEGAQHRGHRAGEQEDVAVHPMYFRHNIPPVG